MSVTDVIGCGTRPAGFSSVGVAAAFVVESTLPPDTPDLISGVIVGLTFVLGATLTVLIWPGAREQARALRTLMRGSYRA